MSKNAITRFNDFKRWNYTEYKKFQSCLSSESEEQLLDLSLEFEKQVALLSDNMKFLLDPSRRQDHVENFKKAVAKGKYCEIDASRVFNDPNSTLMSIILGTSRG